MVEQLTVFAEPEAHTLDAPERSSGERPVTAFGGPEPGVLIDGKYLLERELCSGGMGCVWRARNEALDIPVAVKLLRSARCCSSA